MEYLCRFNIVGDKKEFQGNLILDSESFRLNLVETIPFNQQIDKESMEEGLRYYSEYWDRYNELFYGNNKIEGHIINSISSDNGIMHGKKTFIINPYRVSQTFNKHRVDYIFSFDSIIILLESIEHLPGYYDNVDTDEVLCNSIVSEISWNYDFKYQQNFFRRENMDLRSIFKRHSQMIFRGYLQEVYKISDDDFQFDPNIKKYDLSCFGNLSIDAWKLRKEQTNIGRLPLDCDVEFSLRFDEHISIDKAFNRAKCIVYFFNFILSDFNFPLQFRFLQDNNLFEIKNNYNSMSKFTETNQLIIDEYDILHNEAININQLIINWVNNYEKYKIPFELYKNSRNLNNSIERRLGYIITSLDSLFDRTEPNELKNIHQADVWDDTKQRIKNALPEDSPILERIHTLNRMSLKDKIGRLSEHFVELYESKIEPEIRDSIPIRNWMYHGFTRDKFDVKFQTDDDFANFNISDDRVSLNKKIYILQKIFEFNLLIELGINKEILIEKINSDNIITWLNDYK